MKTSIIVLPLALVISAVPVFAGAKEKTNSEIKCGRTSIERSSCMIRAMLDDIRTTHASLDNGGISEIKSITTYSYQISIPRNEAIDLITYEFEL